MKKLAALVLVIELALCSAAYAQLLLGIDQSGTRINGNCGTLNLSNSNCSITLVPTATGFF